MIKGLGLRIQGLGFRVEGPGSRVLGLGARVWRQSSQLSTGIREGASLFTNCVPQVVST